MKDVYPETSNENVMIKGIQAAVGAVANGIIGNQTLSYLLIALNALNNPLTLQIYGKPVILAKNIKLVAPAGKKALKAYDNSISGSFTYPSAVTPCSIMVQDGQAINGSACHSWLGCPETVICKMKAVTGSRVFKTTGISIAEAKDYEWAVGGLGLLDMYNPAEEGFKKFTAGPAASSDYSDVLRKTNHTVFGIMRGVCVLAYLSGMTGAEVNAFCRDKLKLDMAIMLDGGEHITAINGTESFAKINTAQTQGYIVQGI